MGLKRVGRSGDKSSAADVRLQSNSCISYVRAHEFYCMHTFDCTYVYWISDKKNLYFLSRCYFKRCTCFNRFVTIEWKLLKTVINIIYILSLTSSWSIYVMGSWRACFTHPHDEFLLVLLSPFSSCSWWLPLHLLKA